jgi:hypothetical protein
MNEARVWTTGGMVMTDGTRSNRTKLSQRHSFYQIFHTDWTSDWIRANAVRYRQLTASATAARYRQLTASVIAVRHRQLTASANAVRYRQLTASATEVRQRQLTASATAVRYRQLTPSVIALKYWQLTATATAVMYRQLTSSATAVRYRQLTACATAWPTLTARSEDKTKSSLMPYSWRQRFPLHRRYFSFKLRGFLSHKRVAVAVNSHSFAFLPCTDVLVIDLLTSADASQPKMSNTQLFWRDNIFGFAVTWGV